MMSQTHKSMTEQEKKKNADPIRKDNVCVSSLSPPQESQEGKP